MIEARAPWDLTRDDAVWRLLTNDKSKPRREALSGHHGGRKPRTVYVRFSDGHIEKFGGFREAAEYLGLGLDRLRYLTHKPREFIIRGRHYLVFTDREAENP